MRIVFLIFIFIIILTGCNEKDSSTQQKNEDILPNKIAESNQENNVILGEDLPEINAYAKNIYKKNNVIYIEIDLIEIKYENVDDKIIVNNNPKIRTYIIDKSSLIYSNDCKELTVSELFKIKEKLLKDHSIIIVGTSEHGKMKSLNFGCYG
ncbi:hypothetical protein ACFOWU_03825 [Epilithonimonas zeae]|uniref:Uncharacterized protein n=1 Tax=Epilithonimonas zeae TaxID=1416779 RepID=A0A1N6ES19_9FLAO|nr:hypothetical protein [Epilithonimonas zeae]SIN85734.1 hypothetical protein SAMN05444409_0810 [Epilithonimonas zeae]